MNYIIVNGLEIAKSDLDDFSAWGDSLTGTEANKIIMDAIALGANKKDVQNALSCFGELYGWTKDNCRQIFVEIVLFRADYWGLSYTTKAEGVAKYIIRKAGEDICKAREYVAKNGNDVDAAMVQK